MIITSSLSRSIFLLLLFSFSFLVRFGAGALEFCVLGSTEFMVVVRLCVLWLFALAGWQASGLAVYPGIANAKSQLCGGSQNSGFRGLGVGVKGFRGLGLRV